MATQERIIQFCGKECRDAVGSQQELLPHPLLEDRDFQERGETSCQAELWASGQGAAGSNLWMQLGIAGDFDRWLEQTGQAAWSPIPLMLLQV